MQCADCRIVLSLGWFENTGLTLRTVERVPFHPAQSWIIAEVNWEGLLVCILYSTQSQHSKYWQPAYNICTAVNSRLTWVSALKCQRHCLPSHFYVGCSASLGETGRIWQVKKVAVNLSHHGRFIRTFLHGEYLPHLGRLTVSRPTCHTLAGLRPVFRVAGQLVNNLHTLAVWRPLFRHSLIRE